MHKVLITGASSGLGKALAHQLAKKNCTLLLTGRDQAKLSHLASFLRPWASIDFFPCNVTDPQDVKRLIHEMEKFRPDTVINNAGSTLYGPLLNHRAEEQLKQFDVNTKAPFEITLMAAKMMKEHQIKGTILNVSSVAAYFTFPYLALYSASKRFLLHFSKCLDAELKEHAIRVLASCPGQINTDFAKRASKGKYLFSPKSAMTPEYAAGRIVKQIEKKKKVDVFNYRSQIAVLLTRIFPDFILIPFFKRAMKKRFMH